MGDKTVMIAVEKLLKEVEAKTDERLRQAVHERRKETDAIRRHQEQIANRVGSLERSRLFVLAQLKAVCVRLGWKPKKTMQRVNAISTKLEPDEAAEFNEEMRSRMNRKSQ